MATFYHEKRLCKELQENILIALDIFQKTIQNKPIETELEAWLTFLSCDQPERIIQLLEQFPFFKEIYQEIYDICQNIEEVMRMFSKELYALDKNTVQNIIDELGLLRPIYKNTACFGHFGREEFPWDEIKKVKM